MLVLGKILPRRRVGGTNSRDHSAPVLLTSEAGHHCHGHLLPARSFCPVSLICRSGTGKLASIKTQFDIMA